MTAKKKQATKWQIYTATDPTVTRIIPELAVEIGLNESIVLMQISFWVKISENVNDDKYWTYHSLREMKTEAFPYWSIATIRRTIKNLEGAGYILVGNYNKRKGDNTQWFALEPDKCSALTSVLVAPFEREVFQNETAPSQNETPQLQNETTLPETPTDIKILAPNSADKTPVPAALMNPMKDAIAAAFQYKWEMMAGTEKGLVQKAARELCLVGVKPNEVASLYAYCAKNFTKFKPMALPGNVSDWRKSTSSTVSVLDGLRIVS